MPVITAFLRSS